MKKSLLILIIILSIVFVFCGCEGTAGGVSNDMYIGVAEQIMAKNLKKPSSLEVNDAYIYEKDDYGSAIVCMDITSENWYGGADRDTVYVCVMHLQSDGRYQFHPTVNYTENIANLDMLKSINGFGKPKK